MKMVLVIEEMNPTNNLVFDFCFEFIYPLSLSYNNEVIVTVNSIEELSQCYYKFFARTLTLRCCFPF